MAKNTYPTISRLPRSYSLEIGRVISRFALLEANLRHVIYALLDVNPKLGRLAVRSSPRIEDTISMIEDVMGVRGIKPNIDMKMFREQCKKLQAFRDGIAHGVWLRHPQSKAPILQVTAGTLGGALQVQPQQKGQKVNSKINPLAAGISLKVFRNYAKGVGIGITWAQKLHHGIQSQLRALRSKHR